MSDAKYIPVIGVVGGIGSGKSFFAQTLAKHKNVVIVEGDGVGHMLLTQPEIQERIRKRFGADVFAADGTILRRALGERVFGTSDPHKAAKADLESIVHPSLSAELQRQIAETRAAGIADAIILDAAVLLEAGWRKFCDAVVLIDVPPDIRLQRVQSTRGWSESEFHAREATQFSIEKKRAAADYVLENVGPIEVVQQKCFDVLNDIIYNSSRKCPPQNHQS